MKPNDKQRDDGVELETQVILRLPEEPAKLLREAIREGSNNLKDRLTVKLENDVRYGEVRFDHWLLHAKVVDIPTVIESLKTIDGKSFYKTADVCQMIICKEEPDAPTPEDESPKNKKKDPNKVDKKFLWPHGLTPPCKNIRKRRFRKTLKKKFVEAPEIEKEVKRLLRADNEAVNCKWDLITEEDDSKNISLQNEMGMDNSSMGGDVGGSSGGQMEKSKKSKSKGGNQSADSSQMPRDIDIFGEDLSSSDEDDHHNINVELDENSRLSADDSRSEFNSMHGHNTMTGDKLVTEFNKTMFNSPTRTNSQNSGVLERSHHSTSMMRHQSGSSGGLGRDFFDNDRHESDENEFMVPQMSQDSINTRIGELRRQLNDLHNQRSQKEAEISSIGNQALRQRLQDSLDNILVQILEREMEMQEYQSMLA